MDLPDNICKKCHYSILSNEYLNLYKCTNIGTFEYELSKKLLFSPHNDCKNFKPKEKNMDFLTYTEIMRRCSQDWVARKVLSQYNESNNTSFTMEDVEKAREKFGTNTGHDKTKCSLVVCGSDDHYCCTTYAFDDKDSEGRVVQRQVFNMDYYKRALERFLCALEKNYYNWSWGENINEMVFLHAGDPIEGLGVFRTQGYVVSEGMGSFRDQRNAYINDSAIPILEWGKQKFGKSRMTLVCDSNHTQKGYDTPEYNNEIFNIADALIAKGYDINQQEITNLYVYTDVKNWGFLTTHGTHLAKKYLAPLRETMLQLKSRFPQVQVVGSGHWHFSMSPTKIVDTDDKTQLWYYRTGSPKVNDRHSSKFGFGSNKWFTMIVHENRGIIDVKEFAFAPERIE